MDSANDSNVHENRLVELSASTSAASNTKQLLRPGGPRISVEEILNQVAAKQLEMYGEKGLAELRAKEAAREAAINDPEAWAAGYY